LHNRIITSEGEFVKMEMILAALIGGMAGVAINWLADWMLGTSPTKIILTWRPWAVVVIAAIAFAILWTRFGTTLQTFCLAIYTLVFLHTLVTDLEDRAVFPIVLVPATLVAIVASSFLPMGLTRALLGGVSAFVIVFGIYAFAGLYARLRKLNIQGGAFGRGDVYLATFMGVVVGFPTVFPAIVYTIFLAGAGFAVFLIYQFIQTRKLLLNAALPYGPFFCLVGWVLMVFPI
jgi:leader peptidase (prepilin peptidase)/N-methyltransferase